MPLQNRVSVFGTIEARPERGTMMGNRGGRIHDPATKTLLKRAHASKAWICCVTSFKDRQRQVMGQSYTELFFLDEVTALAAGHRPCFECRRKAANAFQSAWQNAQALSEWPKVAVMDPLLHRERLAPPIEFEGNLWDLPDGSVLVHDDQPYALKGDRALKWSFSGYEKPTNRSSLKGPLLLLTPASIIAALKHGYEPIWHPTAMT